MVTGGAENMVTVRVIPGAEKTSTHVALREAVRPVIVAHGVLARQQAAAGTLAAEVQELTELTRGLLRKLGRVHLLTAGAGQAANDRVAPSYGDHFADAYAEAGMAWAEVAGSTVKLADLLIDAQDWVAAGLIADVLAECDEQRLSAHVRGQLNTAQDAYFHKQYASITFSGTMPVSDIRYAIAVLKRLQGYPQFRSAFGNNDRWSLLSSTQIAAKQHGVAARSMLADVYAEAMYGQYPPTEELLLQLQRTLSMCDE